MSTVNQFIHKYAFVIALLLSMVVSLFFQVYRADKAPGCFNADEASFGYNAYSILKTGKDEYGTPLPVRLTSFGDYKMPLYSYLSIPFVATFGLTETATRMLNTTLTLLLPLIIFLLVKELFNNKYIAIIASFLSALSVGLHIVSRHAHEAYLSVILISVTLLFFIRFVKKFSINNSLLFLASLLLLPFSYQSARLYALLFFILSIIFLWQTKQLKKWFLTALIIVVGLFFITDFIYKPTRVSNLLIFSNKGFALKLDELRAEGGIDLLYNSFFQSAHDIVFQHLSYFSPQFLVLNGDDNKRFGFPGMSPITPVEYILIFIGLYFLFRNNERWRWLLMLFFVISPVTASLSWADMSLTRSLFFLIPIIIIASYGAYHLVIKSHQYWRWLIAVVLISSFFFFSVFSWDFYLFHYPKRAIVQRAWQCGYKELGQYLKDNHSRYDTFYISREHGMPYIFTLFYLQYPPHLYQRQAKLSQPDEYGFGQVEKFDKFIFTFHVSEKSRTTTIGYPDEFVNSSVDQSKLRKIIFGTEHIFSIYENP